VSLTVAGFAPPRTARLRGRGGTQRRGDNGVSPPPREDSSEAIEAGPESTLRPASARDPVVTPAKSVRPKSAAVPAPRPAPTPVVVPTPKPRAKARPAALEWQDIQVPVLGRLWAGAWWPTVLLAGCLVALMYLLQTSGVATTGYDIQRLQADRDDWQLRNEQLQLELAKRRSLTWIEAEATTRLGMVRPEPTALTYLKVGR